MSYHVKDYVINCNLDLYMMVMQIKKKSDLIEMIIYGHINNELKNKVIEDISYNKAVKLLKEKNINVKGLPGYGNIDMKKADIIKKYTKK